MTSTLAMVDRLLTRRAFTSSSQRPLTCRGWPSPSSKFQAQSGELPDIFPLAKWKAGEVRP
jgi:hypothetical protein